MLYKYLASTSLHIFKLLSHFLTPKWALFISKTIRIYDVSYSNAIFGTSNAKTNKIYANKNICI